MTTTEVESRLQNYKVLDDLITQKLKALEETDMRKVAIAMGPKDITVPDLTETHVQHSHRDWLDEYLDQWEQMKAKKKIISDEISLNLGKQNEILLMVSRAELDENESLYVELRYFQGHQVKEVEDLWPGGKSDTWLADIRKSALQKIADNQSKGEKQCG